MVEQKTPLEDLELYLGVEHSLMNVLTQSRVEGILERTVKALEAGATPDQIIEVFSEYIPARQPDRTYG